MEPVIRVEDLSVSYGRKRILTNVFMKLFPGNIYGVLGPNGAGKSTLFKAILGLLEPDNGLITVLNEDVERVREKVVYIPQKDDIDWDFPATVQDIVLMGRYPFKKLWQKISKRDYQLADQALERLGILHLKNRQIGELSGGQQQRAFIARAICQDADIYLMDEPFVGVDIKTEQSIIDLLKELSTKGKTFLVVHHDLSTAKAYFDQVILLNQRLIAIGDMDTTFTDENIARTYGGQLTILHKTGVK